MKPLHHIRIKKKETNVDGNKLKPEKSTNAIIFLIAKVSSKLRLLKLSDREESGGSKQHIASCTALLPIILCKSGFPKYRAPPRATSLSRLLITLRVTNTSLELSRLVRRRNTPVVRYFAPCPANTHPGVLYTQRIKVQICIIERLSPLAR